MKTPFKKMKTPFDLKKEITAIAIVLSSIAYGQVGINNTDPKATLDVTAKTNDGSKAEGIIAPRLTGDQIKAADTQYTSAQTGAIVYATAAVGTSTTKTANITDAGYYYFDGSVWQKMTGSGGGGTDINIYKDNGTLTGNRTVTMDDKTLFFNSTATTGTSHFNVDGSTLNVDAVNNRVGVGTTTPYANMEVKATATTTVPDGIIIPKLTRLELTNKGNTLYGANQKGALIYITDITGGNTLSQRVNVTSEGYYYFDGSVWVWLMTSSPDKFIPYVVAGGRADDQFNLYDSGGYAKTIFSNISVNDGNWNTTTNQYTVKRAGFYQISFFANIITNTNSNRIDLYAKVGATSYALKGMTYTAGYWFYTGGVVTVYANVNDVIELGIVPCQGCTSYYSVKERIFTIINMGG